MYVFISVIVYSFIIKDEKITNYGYYNLNNYDIFNHLCVLIHMHCLFEFMSSQPDI